MSKALLFNKNEALLKAMNIFWAKGYNGTSLEDLTKGLNIGKGSFYNTFKSKRHLFESCIDIYRTNSINGLKEILSNEKDLTKGLENFLKINLEYAINDPQYRGCFITNTCTELASTDEHINELMTSHYLFMKAIIKEYLSAGSDLSSKEIDAITNTIITFFIGMTVEVKLRVDKNQMIPSIEKLVQSLL